MFGFEGRYCTANNLFTIFFVDEISKSLILFLLASYISYSRNVRNELDLTHKRTIPLITVSSLEFSHSHFLQ